MPRRHELVRVPGLRLPTGPRPLAKLDLRQREEATKAILLMINEVRAFAIVGHNPRHQAVAQLQRLKHHNERGHGVGP
eukprot:4424167-Alexandrium_andersonii.AAC.1